MRRGREDCRRLHPLRLPRYARGSCYASICLVRSSVFSDVPKNHRFVTLMCWRYRPASPRRSPCRPTARGGVTVVLPYHPIPSPGIRSPLSLVNGATGGRFRPFRPASLRIGACLNACHPRPAWLVVTGSVHRGARRIVDERPCPRYSGSVPVRGPTCVHTHSLSACC